MSSSWWADLEAGRVTVTDGLMEGPSEIVDAVAAQLLTGRPVEVTPTGPTVDAGSELAITALLARYPDARLSSNAPDMASLIALPPGAVG